MAIDPIHLVEGSGDGPIGPYALIESIDRKHGDNHKRLRDTLAEQHDQIENNYQHFNTKMETLRSRLDVIEAQTARPDASKLTLASWQIVAVCSAILALGGSYWRMTARVDALAVQITTQQQVWERAQLNVSKTQDLQYQQLRESVTDAKKSAEETKRNYELLRYDVQGLKETVLKRGGGG